MATPMLGNVSAITITSPNLSASLEFYQKLGFTEVGRNDFPFSWIQVSDGSLLIMLREDATPYIALTYYAKELDSVTALLEKEGIQFTQKQDQTAMIRRFLFQSPDCLNISLVTFVEGFKQPVGYTAITLPQSDFFTPEKYPNKACGIFGEFAHPVKDLDLSISFWQKLGFTSVSKFTAPYPWAIVNDGLSIIGLHQTTDFSNPAITYFAADQKDKIEHLKQNGIENFTDRGHGSTILTTPEGQHINLFKMGM